MFATCIIFCSVHVDSEMGYAFRKYPLASCPPLRDAYRYSNGSQTKAVVSAAAASQFTPRKGKEEKAAARLSRYAYLL
jgi:hypothetical protein